MGGLFGTLKAVPVDVATISHELLCTVL